MSTLDRFGVRRVYNALGTSTIVGANIAPPEVIEAAAEALAGNFEIDELQRAACRAIAGATGAEAGCVTSSASSGLAITCAAAMTGADLGRIVRLPDTEGLRDEIILQTGHDINFGGRVSQMVRITGARVVSIGSANHADAFHLRGAIGSRTAAVLYVVNGDIHPAASFISLEDAIAIAHAQAVPLIVDAAAEPDVRPFLRAGADVVITSGQKSMGAPTSGLICGRKDLIRACYLQNWGIGRAMKVGKEGIAGLIAAVDRWYARDPRADAARYQELAAVLCEHISVCATAAPHRVAYDVRPSGLTAQQFANALREGDPPVWVNDATADDRIVIDLRALDAGGAKTVARRIAALVAEPVPPRDDVPYHDLYWSEEKLLRWPD